MQYQKVKENFFIANKNDAIKNLPNQEIVLLDDYLKDDTWCY